MALDLFNLLMADVGLSPAERTHGQVDISSPPPDKGQPSLGTTAAHSPADELQSPGVELVKVV